MIRQKWLPALATLALLNVNAVSADIIIPGQYSVRPCIKIMNLEEYPQISLVGTASIGLCYGFYDKGPRYFRVENGCLPGFTPHYKGVGCRHKVSWIYKVDFDKLKADNESLAGVDLSKQPFHLLAYEFPLSDMLFGRSEDRKNVKGYEFQLKLDGSPEDNTLVLFLSRQITTYDDGSELAEDLKNPSLTDTVITLKNGKRFEGLVTEENEAWVRLKVQDADVTFYRDEIESAEKPAPLPSPVPAGEPSPVASPAVQPAGAPRIIFVQPGPAPSEPQQEAKAAAPDSPALPKELTACGNLAGLERDRCIKDTAILRQDPGLCEHIRDGWAKSRCVPELTVFKNAPAEQAKHLEMADHLESCTPYVYTYTHPLGGQPTERRVEGMVDGKCLFREEVSDKTMLECRYPEEFRKVVARFYRETYKADIYGFKSTGFKAVIDGQEISNPQQAAIERGICVPVDR
ncbi:MAG: hypothetical protein Q8Q08_04415 [Candidatus Omnitrophota bacterium]|nr:hypothetical protein [Candidatus Omnitrophota bacterium]MDZ4242002.1 hypothetical protein [Candidatus Omnitrophota bacterium]